MRKALSGTVLSATLVWGLALPAEAMPTENGSSDSSSTTVSASGHWCSPGLEWALR